jgi:glycosyltransferase involved in cell wall biosynthesis
MRRSASIAEARLPLNLPQEAKVVATYGFFLPHKGLEQMVDAFAIILKEIPDAYLLMVNALYPEMISDETASACRARVRACGLGDRVRMITDFLPDRESFAYLDAADLVVFPYQETAESSSAAARYGMATNRPVACSPLSIFDDLNEVNHRLSGTKPENIATSVIELLRDDALLASKAKAQQVWLAAKSWDQVSMRLAGMLTGLVRAKRWHR